MPRKPKNQTVRGQALIVSSLIIAVLLLSTAYYVFEVKRNVTQNETSTSSVLGAIRLAAVNTMISALSNFTNGGEREVLTADLDVLASKIRDHFHEDQCQLRFTPFNSTPYEKGMSVTWESPGRGTSGAHVDFALNHSGTTMTYYSEFETNITTSLVIESTHTVNGTGRNVVVKCTLYNEDEPALANDVTILFQNQTAGPWTMVDASNNLNLKDCGNGTYLVTFNLTAQDFLQVSANIHDLRDILVIANATSTES